MKGGGMKQDMCSEEVSLSYLTKHLSQVIFQQMHIYEISLCFPHRSQDV